MWPGGGGGCGRKIKWWVREAEWRREACWGGRGGRDLPPVLSQNYGNEWRPADHLGLIEQVRAGAGVSLLHCLCLALNWHT